MNKLDEKDEKDEKGDDKKNVDEELKKINNDTEEIENGREEEAQEKEEEEEEQQQPSPPPQPEIVGPDIQTLQLLVSDLSRRLQNAHHTIDSQRKVVKNAVSNAEIFRSQMSEMNNILRLEAARNGSYMRKKVKDEESMRYETDKKKASKMHDDMRMSLLDHQMTGMKREPAKLQRMKSKLEKLDSQQESQKLLLQHLSELEKMTEDLSTAAQNGDLVSCSALVRRGASVNEIDSAGYLPLHYACSNGYTEVVKLLLEFGCDSTAYLTGYCPTEIAARHGHGEVIKVLFEFGASLEEKGLAGSPAIVSAAAGGFLQTVDELIALGADINAYDLNENTALHVATRLQDPATMIKLLLKRGANIQASNKQGHSPLKMALTLVNAPAIEALGGRGFVDNDDEDEDDYGHNDDGNNNYGNGMLGRKLETQSIASSLTFYSERPH